MANRQEIEAKVPRICGQIVSEKGYVAPVDMFLALSWLSKEDYENWRFGRIPYLEKVMGGSLNRLSWAMKCLRQWASHSKLKPSQTVYKKRGKGSTIVLRFSKYNQPQIEKSYSTHFVLPKRANSTPASEPSEPAEDNNSY